MADTTTAAGTTDATTTTTDATTTDATTTDAPAKATKIAAAKAVVAAAAAKVAEVRMAAEAVAEAARAATLTDAQKTEEAHKSLRAELDAERTKLADERKALATDARRTAVERLGITPKAFALAPDVDPRTSEGAQALEAWAKANPEFLIAKPIPAYSPSPPPAGSRLEKILSGAANNPYMPTQVFRELLAKIR